MVVADARPTGERKQVTAVFLDIVNFSEIASTADAEDLQSWLEEYYQKSGAIIEENGGEVTEYLGDGLIAIFGLSRADELAALRAVRAAQQAVDRFGAPFGRARKVEIRAGIATGEVVVRAETPRNRWPRITGRVTTLAQRVQDKAMPNSVVMSQSTERLLRGQIPVTPMPNQTLKGFADVQTLYVAQKSPIGRPVSQVKEIVGRDRELAALRQAEGPVLIVGQAGIGKSALAEQLAASVPGQQFIVADGVTVGSSYGPFKDWLLFSCAKHSPEFADLHAHFAGLSDRDYRCLALILGLQEGQSLLTEVANLALKGFIETAIWSAIQSVLGAGVLVFEDVHWFDAASLDVLAHILDRYDGSRLKLIVTGRPHAHVTTISQRDDIGQMTIEPLTAEGASSLLDRLNEGRLEPAAKARLLERAAGIPLFLEQLLMRGPARAGETVPETLMGLLAERIDDAGAGKPLLQKVSAVGRVFSLDMAAAIAPEQENIRQTLDGFVDAGVLWKRSDTDWAFRHALLGEAAYQSILRKTRRDLHGRIAEVLITQFPESVARDPAVLAEHQRKAGALPDAIVSFLAASKSALFQGAFVDAEAHARLALKLCSDPELDAARPDLEIECYTAIGSVLMQYQGFTAPAVRDAFDQVHKIARSRALPEPESAAALFGSFSYAIMAADRRKSDEFQDLLSSLSRRSRDHDSSVELRLAALAAENCSSFYQGDFANQFDKIAEIRRQYVLQDHAMMIARYGMDIFAAAQMFEAPARAICGQSDQVEPLVAETDLHQDHLNIPAMRPYALVWGAVPLFYAGHVDRARGRLAQGQAVADEQGAVFWQLTGAAWAHVMVEADTYSDDHLSTFGGIVGTYEAIGANIGVPYFRAVYASQLARSGDGAAALDASAAAVQQSRESGLHFWYPEILRLHAGICAAQGSTEEALCAVDLGIDTAQRQGAALWALRGLIDRASLAPADVSRMEAVLARFAPGSVLPELDRARALLATS